MSKKRAKSRLGSAKVYDWEEWFEASLRKPLKLRRGTHFDCIIMTFHYQLRNAASRAGWSVSLKGGEDSKGEYLLLTNNGKIDKRRKRA